MRESLKRLKPDRFEDIIAMVALYRPGPMDNIPTYINRKHGEEPVDCLHPLLEPILKETYGVIIYQEQVHADRPGDGAATRSGEADLLRRAMGKKDKAEMAKQQAALRRRRGEERRQEGRRRLHLRAGRQVRRLRLQQEPRRGLCARQLSHRLPEGELPRGVPRRLDDARHGQHRQARACSRPRRRRAASRCSRPASTPPRSISSPSHRADREAGRHPLFAGRARRTSAPRPSQTIVAEREAKGRYQDLADFAARARSRRR